MDQMRTIEQSNGTKLPFVGLGTWLTPDHEQLKAALRAALECGYRYIDTASRYENEHVIGEVLQEFYDAGKLKREDVFITTKLAFYAHEPAIELHILWPQREMIELCRQLGITVTSFSTLGSPGRAASPASRFVAGDCLGHPVVQQLAAKYAKTPAQILLRHTIQQGISVIPKSVSPDRLKQNIDVFDFELTAEDQKKLADIDEKEHLPQLGLGYIDTAAAYGNEAAIGDVLQEYYDAGKLKRENVWLTTKLPFFAHEPEVAEQLIQRSLKNLRTDYLDLYLVHTPLPFKPKDDLSGVAVGEDKKFIPLDIPLLDTWRVVEKWYKKGAFKSIGVSNFNQQQLQDLYDKAEVKPHNLQKEMIALCKKLDLSVTSRSARPGRGASPIAKFVPGDCMGHPLWQELAKKYNKTPAQILLRHTIQQGISVIPKSTNPDRLKQNIDIFDFEISAEHQKKLDDIDEKDHVRLLLQFDFAWHHPNFPFADVDRSSK
ncbi:hypothetical protein M3Y99_01106100 [Aphelenchoides fujianensis]|nr:hypothetical protein M3Y99_01106100 [Aphelenchoides fujianensis]